MFILSYLGTKGQICHLALKYFMKNFLAKKDFSYH